MQECDAGSDCELCPGKVEWELTDVLYPEGRGELAVIHWEAYLLVRFSSADLERSLGQVVSLASR